MKLGEKYKELLIKCRDSGLQYDKEGHYCTSIDFKEQDFYVNEDGSPVIRYVFDVNGCRKEMTISAKKYNYLKSKGKLEDTIWKDKKVHLETIDGKKVMVHFFHKDRIPVFGKIMTTSYKDLLYKYFLFLRSDGIDNPLLLKLFAVKFMIDKFEYRHLVYSGKVNEKTGKKIYVYEEYEPEYGKLEPVIDGLIGSVLNKEIDDDTRKQFEVSTCCVVNSVGRTEFGGVYRKVKCQKQSDARKGRKAATDNKINSLYDPSLTMQENADMIGVSLNTLKRWKKENKGESLKDRINRLYDWNKSLRENIKIIGCSQHSIEKYLVKPEIEVRNEDDDWLDNMLNEDKNKYESSSIKNKEIETTLSEENKEVVDSEMDKWLDEML